MTLGRSVIGRRVAALSLVLAVACSADSGEDGPRSGGSGASSGARPGGESGGDGTTGGGLFDNSGTTVGGGAGAAAVPVGVDPDVPMTCAEGMSYAAPVTPTVWLVIDSSGSMNDPFSGSSRWEALRSALMDPDGVVATLERVVRFGMVIYNGPDNGQAQCNAPENINPDIFGNPACACLFGFEPVCCEAACGGTAPPAPTGADCANLVTVDPALDNFATLDAAYPGREIGGWTPTDRALEHVVQHLPVVAEQVLDAQVDPVYVILATDGAPNDRCGGGGGGGGRGSGFEADVAARVVSAAQTGAQSGMKMFVISLAGGDAQLQAHLDELATIGGTGHPTFEPSTKDDLVMTLQQIIGGATCQVALNGEVQTGLECQGSVELNGNALACDTDDGWRLADPRTVQLTGSACDSFLSNESMVNAAFPCGVFTPD